MENQSNNGETSTETQRKNEDSTRDNLSGIIQYTNHDEDLIFLYSQLAEEFYQTCCVPFEFHQEIVPYEDSIDLELRLGPSSEKKSSDLKKMISNLVSTEVGGGLCFGFSVDDCTGDVDLELRLAPPVKKRKITEKNGSDDGFVSTKLALSIWGNSSDVKTEKKAAAIKAGDGLKFEIGSWKRKKANISASSDVDFDHDLDLELRVGPSLKRKEGG